MKFFKKTQWLIATLLLAVIPFAGCASFTTTAYKVDATTATVVDSAMQAYGSLFRAGQISPNTEMAVQKAYGEYQVVMLAQIRAVQAYDALKAQGSAVGPAQLADAQNKATQALADCSAAVVALFEYLKGAGVAQNLLNPVLATK